MKYSEIVFNHFFNPRNVGLFDTQDDHVGRSTVGRYENGALIHFEIKVNHLIEQDVSSRTCEKSQIIGARFKAFGSVIIIAGCSYATTWLENKSLSEAAGLDSAFLVRELSIPELKVHCALLIEDAVKVAVLDYEKRSMSQLA